MAQSRARRYRLILQVAAAWSLLGAWLPLLGAYGDGFVVGGLVALGCAPPLWVASWSPPSGWPVALLVATVRPAVAGTLLLVASPSGLLIECWVFGELLLLPALGSWLVAALRDHLEEPVGVPQRLQDALPADLLQGRWLVLLVRHAGCTFCRETLSGLGRHAAAVHARGYRIAVVHMGDDVSGARLARGYQLPEARFLADPDRNIYRALSLPRGSLGQLFGPRIWLRGIWAGLAKGHGVGGLDGDGFQLGGTVRIDGGAVTYLHRSRDAADVEDWPALVSALPQ